MQPHKGRYLMSRALALALCGLLGVVAGCGSAKRAAGPSSLGGNALISIQWPQVTGQSRVIPDGTQTIKIRVFVTVSGVLVEKTELGQVVPRPTTTETSTVRMTGLPYGAVLFKIEALGAGGELLATGAQTVDIPSDGTAAAVPVTLALATSAGFATVTVTNIPTPTAASPVTVEARVLQNGAVLAESDATKKTFTVTATAPASSVPLRLGPLPTGSLAFVVTAKSAGGTLLASGSAIAQVSVADDAAVAVALVTQSSGGDTGGSQTTGLSSAVINVSNIATGDCWVVVQRRDVGTGTTYTGANLQLRSNDSDPKLPINSVPILLRDIPAGPWIFEVLTYSTVDKTAADSINRVGAVSAILEADKRSTLSLPLTPIAEPNSVPAGPGVLNVLTTNISGLSDYANASLVVAVFSSSERKAFQVVQHITGVNQRLVTLSVAGGSYSVVSAVYGDTVAHVQDAVENTSGMPDGAIAIGSSTARVVADGSVDTSVELRLQAGTAGSGSVNLAMTQVPVLTELVQVGNTGQTEDRIVSGLLIKVYSVKDNQELTSLQRVMVPPEGVITGTTDADKVVRLRIDGVPADLVRFEVTATSSQNGSGPILGSGSTIARVQASTNAASPPVTAVTVALLPHGDLPTGTVLPGTANPTDPDNNPEPPTPARFVDIRRLLLLRR